MSAIDWIGYAAGAVTLWAMYRQTMIPLRAGAVAGNILFVIFGWLAQSYPTLILHGVLLPLNTWRLIEMMRLVREIRDASDATRSLEPLLPFMRRTMEKAGTVLFRKDDPADCMLLIRTGTIELPEIDVRCGPGDVLGEIAAFTPAGLRTCTAVCQTDCELHVLSNETMIQLFHQNPRFSRFLVHLIVGRLLENWATADCRTKVLPGRSEEPMLVP